jgi:hypothetical protein
MNTQTRANGKPPSAVIAREESDENEKELEVPIPEETSRQLRTPGFHRMRTDWRGEDRIVWDQVKSTAERRILQDYKEVFDLLTDLYMIVRTPATNDDGEILRDNFGAIVWARDDLGRVIENYSDLSKRQKEDFMFRFSTRMVLWEQWAADAWGQAMFAKARWEEGFATEYDKPRQGTIEDRTAKGKIGSLTERYTAVYMTYYSRKAEAVCRSVERLVQRLKDSMTS